MEWFWYSALPNELFLDVDRLAKSYDHIKARLQGAIECEKLTVKEFHLFPSLTSNHAHIVIVLLQPLFPLERFAWEIVFHSDIYRGCCNIMRYHNAIQNPDILIGRLKYHREPDAYCECEEKHTRKIMQECPAAALLRGKDRTTAFFGKPSKNPCKFL